MKLEKILIIAGIATGVAFGSCGGDTDQPEVKLREPVTYSQPAQQKTVAVKPAKRKKMLHRPVAQKPAKAEPVRPKQAKKPLTQKDQMLSEIIEGYRKKEFWIEPQFRNMKYVPKQAVLAYFRAHAWNDPKYKKKGTWFNAWAIADDLGVDLDIAALRDRKAPVDISDLGEKLSRNDYRKAIAQGKIKRPTVTKKVAKKAVEEKPVVAPVVAKPLKTTQPKPLEPRPVVQKPVQPKPIEPKPYTTVRPLPRPKVKMPTIKVSGAYLKEGGRSLRPANDPTRGRIPQLRPDPQIQMRRIEARDSMREINEFMNILKDSYQRIAGGGEYKPSQSLLSKAQKTCMRVIQKTSADLPTDYTTCKSLITDATNTLRWIDKNLGLIQQFYHRIKDYSGVSEPVLEDQINKFRKKVRSETPRQKYLPVKTSAREESFKKVASEMYDQGASVKDISDILGTTETVAFGYAKGFRKTI